jgi:RNA polymerase primary sigma factor
VLTYDEIAKATAELGLDEADLEGLHGLFEGCEIELVEETPHRAAPLDLEPEMTTDALQLLFKDIGRVRLLTAQEEADLAERIERGPLDAKQKMIESNVRLVVSIAKNYRNQGPRSSI